jgi:hypothetical protein
MAIWYTDVAALQQQGINFPGTVGQPTGVSQPPGNQNNPLFENDYEIVGTYTWTGTEAAGDTINIGLLNAGVCVDPNGHVASGLTAPAATLTVAIGDNDLTIQSNLPIVNPTSFAAQPTNWVAPTWVSGTSYVAGNVVIDAAASAAPFAQYDVFMAVVSTSGTTAPHSAGTAVWMPNYQRYSSSIDIHAASGNVSFAGGTQFYGGPASVVPYSTTPGSSPSGAYPTLAGTGFSGPTNAQWIANQQYQIQYDCWLTARILTAATVAANAVSIFRVPLMTDN